MLVFLAVVIIRFDLFLDFAAYCTGLLLARRVLKMLEMDQEYEGNVEVLTRCPATYFSYSY